ncbi:MULTISPECIES: hypothetical protein [unclassified Streptomyces]|uniref:hypothetical protein n=1 Tax=unclassified Streptomyces TaxID=2593676 RepID=UPI00168BD298|nr:MULTISPECIES: hypothetical protein [unclassified Streptomyces]MBD3004306.1 hypothetical protein [Streptomyces sp. 5-10]
MTTKTLPWMPPNGDDVELVQVGLYWDAVRASADIGECALKLLADASGAVIADYGLMYWLVPAGHAQDWRGLQQVQALCVQGAAVTYVGVPPAGWTDGPRLHWRIPVGPDRYLTDAVRLREVLVRAIAAEPAEGATAR